VRVGGTSDPLLSLAASIHHHHHRTVASPNRQTRVATTNVSDFVDGSGISVVVQYQHMGDEKRDNVDIASSVLYCIVLTMTQ